MRKYKVRYPAFLQGLHTSSATNSSRSHIRSSTPYHCYCHHRQRTGQSWLAGALQDFAPTSAPAIIKPNSYITELLQVRNYPRLPKLQQLQDFPEQVSYLYLRLDITLIPIRTEEARDQYTDKGVPSQPFYPGVTIPLVPNDRKTAHSIRLHMNSNPRGTNMNGYEWGTWSCRVGHSTHSYIASPLWPPFCNSPTENSWRREI